MNEISLKLFLFGGVDVGDGNARGIDAFNSFTEFADQTLESFETFKGTVKTLVEEFRWTGDMALPLDAIGKGEEVQVFEMPEEEELRELYQAALQSRKD